MRGDGLSDRPEQRPIAKNNGRQRGSRVQAEMQQREEACDTQQNRSPAIARPGRCQSGYDQKERNTHHGGSTVHVSDRIQRSRLHVCQSDSSTDASNRILQGRDGSDLSGSPKSG